MAGLFSCIAATLADIILLASSVHSKLDMQSVGVRGRFTEYKNGL